MRSNKLINFVVDSLQLAVTYVETQQVKEGVSCDVYSFNDNRSMDLGIVRVSPGNTTPLQRVLNGTRTIEGFVSGIGTLFVGDQSGQTEVYYFESPNDHSSLEIKIGQTMQWEAGKNSELVFYELCEPPYSDGRFKNLSD